MLVASQAFKRRSGFTIVELLIVIVVIAILAAISIVAYNGIQNRAYDTTVQSDLSTLSKKMSVDASTSGNYVLPTASTEFSASKSAYMDVNNLYVCINTSTNQYALAARSKSKKQFKLVNGQLATSAVLYGADTCALVGTTADAGGFAYGYNASAGTWFNWVN